MRARRGEFEISADCNCHAEGRISPRLEREIAATAQQRFRDGLDQVEKTMGPSAGLTQTRLAVLQRAGKNEEAAAVQTALVKQSWHDAQMLNEIAWGIAIGRGDRDLDLALRTAARAAELTNHADASILDTLARVYYEQGKLKEAFEWQTKAVEHDSGNPQIAAAIKKYEAELAEQGSAEQPPAGEKDPTPGDNATPPETAESPATP
jgi:hypothetical protein